jgi:trigger factor
MLESHYYDGLVEAGCDEAGRGCLAGSVYAAAVILPPDYTNDLLNDAQPLMLDELDIVPVERPDFGEEPALVVEHQDYVITATIQTTPTTELDSYEGVSINMPPAEATEAEIDNQIAQILSYQMKFEDVEEDRGAEKGDVINVDIANLTGAEDLAGTNHTMVLAADSIPEELVEGIVGMHKGEKKQVSWSRSHMHGDHEHTHEYEVEVTLNAIRVPVTPELTDELAKTSLGFDTVEEFRAALAEEITEDKKRQLPSLKENRVVAALGERAADVEVPEAYENQVFQELANEFLTSLQNQGMSLDRYLGAREIDTDTFLADLHEQAREHARQAMALDALARAKGFEATLEDVREEFAKAVEDVEASIEQFRNDGRLSAIRESIRRTKAVQWLVEHAEVTEVDEAAEHVDSEQDQAGESDDAE